MLKSWKFWLGCLLLIALLWLVERSYGWTAVLASWQSIPLDSLLVALTLIFISYILRAVRFYDFFYSNCRGHFVALTRLTVLHNFFNNLLPMRSGETAFPLLMKQYFNVPFHHSAPALLWLRLLDLYALLMLALVSLHSLWPVAQEIKIAVSIALVVLPLLVLPLQMAIKEYLLGRESSWAQKASELMHALPDSAWSYSRALFWTIINWALKLAVYTWLLQQFTNIEFFQSWMGATAGELSSVLPIHGIAGAGTYEAGVLVGLLPWGVENDVALAAAVNLHLFVLGSTLLLTGLIAAATFTVKRPYAAD